MATYDATRFRTTHNSYSGGKRGSIPQQLDRGVRGVEFDIHTTPFRTFGDFRLVHGPLDGKNETRKTKNGASAEAGGPAFFGAERRV
jgi:hypothetical protein